jgi:hypothetical protein
MTDLTGLLIRLKTSKSFSKLMLTPETKMKRLLITLASMLAWSGLAAGIPEPYNLVYGVIELGGGRAGRESTDVVVEARRLASGGKVASYRMGDAPSAGDYYMLKINLETKVAGGKLSDTASSDGDTLYLTVLNGTQVVDQLAYTLGPRGTVFRIDFGNVDDDQDGIPDGWEQAYLYTAEYGANDDPDNDGLSNMHEYLLGRNPLIPDALHPADINPADGRITIQEASSYYTAWRNGVDKWNQTLADGTEVPRGPAPIPVTYVTRATFLWEQGEYYKLDPAAGVEPLWWVSAPAPEGGGVSSLSFVTLADRKAAALQNENLDDEFVALLKGLPVDEDENSASSKPRLAARSMSGAPSERMLVQTSAPSRFSMDSVIGITNDVQLTPGLRTYAVEHQLPEGWEIVSIESSGYYDAGQGIVRWGPYFDRQPRSLVYYAQPTNPAMTKTILDGASAYDGYDVTFYGAREMFRLPDKPGEFALLPTQGKREWTLVGEAGVRYAIQSSTDMVEWQTEREEVTGASGQIVFGDESQEAGMKFFRAMRMDSTPE